MNNQFTVKLKACYLPYLRSKINIYSEMYESQGYKVAYIIRPVIFWKDFDIINEHVAILTITKLPNESAYS